MNGAAAIERTYGKDAVRFVTLTIPGGGPAVEEFQVRWSGWITNLIGQWLRDNLPGAAFCWVIERQKRGTFHWHYIVGHSDASTLVKLEKYLRDYWRRLLDKIHATKCGAIWGKWADASTQDKEAVLQVRVERVRLNISRYLAKYLSKNTFASITVLGNSPSRWWGANQVCRGLTNSLCEVAVSALDTLTSCVRKVEALKDGAALSDAVGATFSFTNRYLFGVPTLIAFASGANQGIVIDWLKEVLFGGFASHSKPHKKQEPSRSCLLSSEAVPVFEQICSIFGGRAIVASG
jgi:hypothetical protein